MPRERKPSAKVREMQALEEEHGSNFDSLLQQEMINEALAMYQQEKASNDDDNDDGHGDEDVAMIEDTRFLLEQTFKEEDEAMEEDDEDTKKRKKPAGTYHVRWNAELQRRVRTFIPDPASSPKRKTSQLPRSAFSPLFPQMLTNPRLLHDLFLEPQFLSYGDTGGDLLSLALTCKAFAPLLPQGEDTVVFTRSQRLKFLYPARFIASLAAPNSASILTTLHLNDWGLSSAELCYELGDVFTQGLPVLRELKIQRVQSKAFNYTFTKLVSSVHLPALRTLVLTNVSLDKSKWKSVVAALPLPKLGRAGVITTTPALRTVIPLIQLEHLVMNRIWCLKPIILRTLYNYLAYHHAALQTLDCRTLFRAGLRAYETLAAHMKFGNFPALTSLTIHDWEMEESAAAALIDGLDKGCRAVTCLSLGCLYPPRQFTERGLLVKALSQATEKDLEETARSMRPLHSLQTLHLDWPGLAPKKLLKFLFDLDINAVTGMPQPRVAESDFRPPFPTLSSLTIKGVLGQLPVATLKLIFRGYMESGVRNINFTEKYIIDADFHDIVAYLRSILPSLAPSVSMSEEHRFNINLGWRKKALI